MVAPVPTDSTNGRIHRLQISAALNAVIAQLNGVQVAPTTLSATVGTTLSPLALVGGVILRSGPTVAFTDTTDTAANILSALTAAGRLIGRAFDVMVINTSVAAMTIAPGSGVTLAGNTSGGDFVVAAGTTRRLRGVITATATPALTIYA